GGRQLRDAGGDRVGHPPADEPDAHPVHAVAHPDGTVRPEGGGGSAGDLAMLARVFVLDRGGLRPVRRAGDVLTGYVSTSAVITAYSLSLSSSSQTAWRCASVSLSALLCHQPNQSRSSYLFGGGRRLPGAISFSRLANSSRASEVASSSRYSSSPTNRN